MSMSQISSHTYEELDERFDVELSNNSNTSPNRDQRNSRGLLLDENMIPEDTSFNQKFKFKKEYANSIIDVYLNKGRSITAIKDIGGIEGILNDLDCEESRGISIFSVTNRMRIGGVNKVTFSSSFMTKLSKIITPMLSIPFILITICIIGVLSIGYESESSDSGLLESAPIFNFILMITCLGGLGLADLYLSPKLKYENK